MRRASGSGVTGLALGSGASLPLAGVLLLGSACEASIVGEVDRDRELPRLEGAAVIDGILVEPGLTVDSTNEIGDRKVSRSTYPYLWLNG